MGVGGACARYVVRREKGTCGANDVTTKPIKSTAGLNRGAHEVQSEIRRALKVTHDTRNQGSGTEGASL